MANDVPSPISPTTSEADKTKARKWFEQARKVADTKNYDYAIECYISGLRLWPDALDEGHKPLRAVATARKMAGKKGLGFLEARKYSTSGKDYRQNVFNAEFQWAHDPGNISHMEAVVENAAKANCGVVGVWMGLIAADALMQEKKVSAGKLAALCQAMDTMGESAQKASQFQLAFDAYFAMVKIAEIWRRHYPTSQDAAKTYGDATSKQTIVKGRFGTADSFRESLKDKQGQADLQAKDRLVQDERRVDELITKAKSEYEAEPQSNLKVNAYVDLLTRREREEDENLAIDVLTKAYQDTKNYSFKVKADDIRIKQGTRKSRALAARLRAAPGDAQVVTEARLHKTRQLEFEISVFEERAKNYPTDLKVRFNLAERLLKAKRYDDAIPYFQQAQADGRQRSPARRDIGRCFFEKGLFAEAIGTLRQGIAEHEIPSDETGKELHYWLARALEADGKRDDAMAEYGQLVQWEYNYKDARVRLEQLRSSGNEGQNG